MWSPTDVPRPLGMLQWRPIASRALRLKDDPHIGQFWRAYAARVGLGDAAEYSVVSFGDTPDVKDALLELVLRGTKRATASLALDYMSRGQPFPKPGDCNVLIDGQGKPRCIVRTIRVDVKPIRDVDADFAWSQGEGDRSLLWWLSAHVRYFARQGSREGWTVDERTEVVLERFSVVWPLEVADADARPARSDISFT